jgi:hypothetical protein
VPKLLKLLADKLYMCRIGKCTLSRLFQGSGIEIFVMLLKGLRGHKLSSNERDLCGRIS